MISQWEIEFALASADDLIDTYLATSFAVGESVDIYFVMNAVGDENVETTERNHK